MKLVTVPHLKGNHSYGGKQSELFSYSQLYMNKK